MKRKIFILLSFVTIVNLTCYADTNQLEKAYQDVTRRIVAMENVPKSNDMYLASEDRLLIAENGSKDWREIDFSDENIKIKNIALSENNIYLLTQTRIYMQETSPGDSKIHWKWLPSKKIIKGITAPLNAEEVCYVYSDKDIYKIKNRDWTSIVSETSWRLIENIKFRKDKMYVASGSSVFILSSDGDQLARINLFIGENEELLEEDAQENQLFPEIVDMDPYGPDGIAIATAKDVFILYDKDLSIKRINTTGLPRNKVKAISYSEKGLFAATDTNVFRYSEELNSWVWFLTKPFSGEILFIKMQFDQDGRCGLWIAGNNSVYKIGLGAFQENLQEKSTNTFFNEPTILEVQKMAIEYAEVSPEKIKKWRRGARWKAFLPKVSVDFSESTDDNIDIYKSSTKYYVIRGPREVDNDWGVDLTWDLSDLIWNDAQTSIDTRSKLMVQLRDDILEEVTRLYFQRKKLIAETFNMEKPTTLDKKLRIEELTAYIDAFTGGKFSRALNSR